MSEYIPFEIQEEILKRLPVKPLLQFRSVSKSYKRLIDSPDFIVSYGIHRPPDDRFILKYAFEGEVNYLSLVDNENVNSLVQQEFIPTVPDLISRLSVVGSSHGLLCFDGCYDDVLLWNPSIRKSVVIQMPFMYDKYFDGFTGFGVCPVTFDPTIFVIKYVDFKGKMKDTPGMRGAIFTLSNRTWSVLSTNNLYRESIRLCTGSYQVVIDRFIYWTAYDNMVDAEDESPFLILSFDLIAKEFKEINLAGSITNGLCSIESISKLRESLVLLDYHRELVCCLWMMKEHGVSRSFTKLYTINLLPDVEIICLLGFRKTGELIMEMELQSAPYNDASIYDPNSKAIDNLGIGGDMNSFFMCSYMETLLLLDQLDGFIYSIDNQSQIQERLSLVKVE